MTSKSHITTSTSDSSKGPKLTVFEIEAAGFSGESDETDDRIIWVAARSRNEVEVATRDTGATLCDALPDSMNFDGCIDFVLPGQLFNLQECLLEFASIDRNKGRCCD